MKLSLVVALSLVSGMAFAAGAKDVKTDKGGKIEDVTSKEGKEALKKAEEGAKKVGNQSAEAGKVIMSDSKLNSGIELLRKVAAKAEGNKVYEAAGGIADAAATGDQRSVEVATRLAELIKADKSSDSVIKAFDKVVEEFKLNKDEVVENCGKK